MNLIGHERTSSGSVRDLEPQNPHSGEGSCPATRGQHGLSLLGCGLPRGDQACCSHRGGAGSLPPWRGLWVGWCGGMGKDPRSTCSQKPAFCCLSVSF